MKFNTTFVDVAEPTPCHKCKVGFLHFEYGGETGYKLECDNEKCRHSFPVTLGKKKEK